MNHKTDIPLPSTPCQRHPGDWFDRSRQTFTRRHCLNCTGRGACAATALRIRPDHGMWAGIWIDGDFAAKRHLLAGRAPTPPPAVPPPAGDALSTPRRAPRGARRRRVGRLCTTAPPPQLAALVAARASGHCEIMAPACTYAQSAIFTRRRGAVPDTLSSPADAVVACANCIDLIERTELPTALDLGYLVDARTASTAVAMYWRQHRWVYLDTRGRLQPCDTGARVGAIA